MVGSIPFGKNTPTRLGGVRICRATSGPGSLAVEFKDRARRLAVCQVRLNPCGARAPGLRQCAPQASNLDRSSRAWRTPLARLRRQCVDRASPLSPTIAISGGPGHFSPFPATARKKRITSRSRLAEVLGRDLRPVRAARNSRDTVAAGCCVRARPGRRKRFLLRTRRPDRIRVDRFGSHAKSKIPPARETL